MTRLAFASLALVLACSAPAGSPADGSAHAARAARAVPPPPSTMPVGAMAGDHGALVDTAATREWADSMRAHGLATTH